MGVETASSLVAKLKNGELKREDLIERTRESIQEKDEQVCAFLTPTFDFAKQQAAGEVSVPIAVKDNICVKGVRTTCASRMLAHYVSPYQATVIDKLIEKGVPIIGKTNMDEFAMGSSCEYSAFFPTSNPWDLSCVPGGSSGGSAAAVASGEVSWAIGSDTGGSIRQPAALCGIVGLKPTYGVVSRYGLIAFASSLDQIGTFTLDVQDAALLLTLIAGHDPKDATSLSLPSQDYQAKIGQSIQGMRVGVLENLLTEEVEEGVRERVKEAVQTFEGLGAEISMTKLPFVEEALATYYILAPAECSANLSRYDGTLYGLRKTAPNIKECIMRTRDSGFGEEVKRRILIGTYVLSAGYYDAYYLKAQQVRRLIRDAFVKLFQEFDLLLSPTSPTVAFPKGEKVKQPVSMYTSDLCTIPVNLAGTCAISVPCGLANDLPVGLQLIGNFLGEQTLLQAAYAYEQARGPFLAPDLIPAC